MDAEFENLLETLRPYAVRLNQNSEPSPQRRVFYEVMSGGLMWSDEGIENMSAEAIWALRPLLNYRTSVMTGAPKEKFRTYWEACMAMFPRWVAFRPERSIATPELLQLLPQPKIQPPCPYCGAPLFTVRSKQCLQCGWDWHDAARPVQRPVKKRPNPESCVTQQPSHENGAKIGQR